MAWPGVDHLARERRAHVDDAVDRGADLGVVEVHLRLLLLRAHRRPTDGRSPRGRRGARRPGRRCPCARATAASAACCLFAQRLDVRLRGGVRRARLVEGLRRLDALAVHRLLALEGQPRVLRHRPTACATCAWAAARFASAWRIWLRVCASWKRRLASASRRPARPTAARCRRRRRRRPSTPAAGSAPAAGRASPCRLPSTSSSCRRPCTSELTMTSSVVTMPVRTRSPARVAERVVQRRAEEDGGDDQQRQSACHGEADSRVEEEAVADEVEHLPLAATRGWRRRRRRRGRAPAAPARRRSRRR